MASPKLPPAPWMPMARPRSPVATPRDSSDSPLGWYTPALIPSRIRPAASSGKLGAAATSSSDTVQPPAATTSMRREPNRSARKPAGMAHRP